jgi:ABC-type glutathione transport system ATPase component
VLALLRGLCREAGTTLLVASHGEEVARRADRVVVLSAGRLHERGASP